MTDTAGYGKIGEPILGGRHADLFDHDRGGGEGFHAGRICLLFVLFAHKVTSEALTDTAVFDVLYFSRSSGNWEK